MALAQLARAPRKPWRSAFELLVLLSALVLVVAKVANRLWDPTDAVLVLSLGPLAVWRYGWWTIHLIRSLVYRGLVFRRLRRRADDAWARGERPPFVHFLVTTFKEKPSITRAVLAAIFAECRSSGVPARVFFATGHASDEHVIEDYCSSLAGIPAQVIMVRQNQSGKRAAIGVALRAMSRYGVGPRDLAVLMDGDTILGARILEKCAPLFDLKPHLGAVTTDESALVDGPAWMQSWCNMRFAQRRLAMQSHSLSGKVLTLTGRMSAFRAEIVVREDFIRTVESEQIEHWLWGRFRFLSGDDKSTWFSLLQNGYQMLYVPDAIVTTIESIGNRPFERTRANLLRWSGNMLRNGSRALALGPRRCGFFIWWCLVDQRLSIWTSLTGLLMALLVSAAAGSVKILAGYLVWVLITRAALSLVLFFYAGRVDLSFPFLLYASQIAASLIKIYLLFRVSKQRWLNRGDQRSKLATGGLLTFQNAMAAFLTAFYLGIFVFVLALLVGILDWHTLASNLL